jgi:hypothetical protein
MVELQPTAKATPTPMVIAAQEAATAASALPASGPVVFKPLQETMATRSVIFSAVGLLLCFLPVVSLTGLVMGLLAQRRIKRSNGNLLGGGSARFGIMLGAIGLAVGATVDMVFLVRN